MYHVPTGTPRHFHIYTRLPLPHLPTAVASLPTVLSSPRPLDEVSAAAVGPHRRLALRLFPPSQPFRVFLSSLPFVLVKHRHRLVVTPVSAAVLPHQFVLVTPSSWSTRSHTHPHICGAAASAGLCFSSRANSRESSRGLVELDTGALSATAVPSACASLVLRGPLGPAGAPHIHPRTSRARPPRRMMNHMRLRRPGRGSGRQNATPLRRPHPQDTFTPSTAVHTSLGAHPYPWGPYTAPGHIPQTQRHNLTQTSGHVHNPGVTHCILATRTNSGALSLHNLHSTVHTNPGCIHTNPDHLHKAPGSPHTTPGVSSIPGLTTHACDTHGAHWPRGRVSPLTPATGDGPVSGRGAWRRRSTKAVTAHVNSELGSRM